MASTSSSPLIAPLAPVSLLPPAAVATSAPGPAAPYPGAVPDPAAATPATPPARLGDTAAMRTDQVFMARQLAWPAFDGAALAGAWRAMVRTYGEQLAELHQHNRGQHVPAALLLAARQGAAGAQAALSCQHPSWRFVLPGPGGQQLALRVLAGSADPPPGRRRRAKAALRLELILADGSHATVHLELTDRVLLEMAAEHPSAVAQLRLALPEVQHAIEHAGLTLGRASARQGLTPGPVLSDYTEQIGAALPAPLFRAIADIALLLAAAPLCTVPGGAAACRVIINATSNTIGS